VADRVDAAVDDVEATFLDAALDFVARVSERDQLPVRHDAILPIRQRADGNAT
jgi:hypothetical protein